METKRATALAAYWHVGREIDNEEQRGQERAGYGERLVQELSKQLTADFGRGFSVANLSLIRQFYLTYRDRWPKILYAVSRESSSPELLAGTAQSPAGAAVPMEAALPTLPDRSFQPGLSWSHYHILMRVDRLDGRSFYEVECSKARWLVREWERQIALLLYERLALSRDKEGLLALAEEGRDVQRAEDLLSQSARQVFASRYRLHLPTEEELVRELRREREIIESQQA